MKIFAGTKFRIFRRTGKGIFILTLQLALVLCQILFFLLSDGGGLKLQNNLLILKQTVSRELLIHFCVLKPASVLFYRHLVLKKKKKNI
jgi:hypothetical protein